MSDEKKPNETKHDIAEILTLNSYELIKWCNVRKKQMGLSNAKLANITKVPEGTLDRILTGKNPEFRYSTIQPVVKLLIGLNDETPSNESEEYYADTIDAYKIIVKNKNQIISEQQRLYQLVQTEKEYLKKNNTEKQNVIDKLTKHIEWLETLVDTKTKG